MAIALPSAVRLALLVPPALMLASCGSKKTEETSAVAEPTAPSSEWVAENPTEAAVPVKLPDTTLTNSADAKPVAKASPAGK